MTVSCASAVASSSSILISLRTAFERAANQLSVPIDFAFVFISGDGLSDRKEAIWQLWNDLAPGVPLFGGSAESVVGSKLEIEGQCAASVLLISGLEETPQIRELECIHTPDGTSVMGVTEELIRNNSAGLLLMACPISFSMELLADILEYEKDSPTSPVLPLVGGYCSSQNWQSPSLLFAGDRVVDRGAVAMSMPKGWEWHTVVSQGCRPVGDPYIITAMEGPAVRELGGKPAMEQLRDLFASLPVNEQHLISSSLMMGRAINEFSETFSHGEFLIRAVQGIDADHEGLVVTDRFQVGQTIRFHVRDSEAADADLRQLLSKKEIAGLEPEAGLLFTCNGRGSNMFSTPSHDATVLDEYFPGLPTAGCFAAGEFAPIGNQNLVHAFSAVVHLLLHRPTD